MIEPEVETAIEQAIAFLMAHEADRDDFEAVVLETLPLDASACIRLCGVMGAMIMMVLDRIAEESGDGTTARDLLPWLALRARRGLEPR